MSLQLILATATISLALVFYTIGVFDERKHSLTKRILSCFGRALCSTPRAPPS